MNKSTAAVDRKIVWNIFSRTIFKSRPFSLRNHKKFSNLRALQIFEHKVPLSILNRKIFERDLLSSDNIIKSATPKPWGFLDCFIETLSFTVLAFSVYVAMSIPKKWRNIRILAALFRQLLRQT